MASLVGGRLRAARRLDWRFLLDEPRLESVCCLQPIDEAEVEALRLLDIDVTIGTVDDLAGTRRRWQVAVVGRGPDERHTASSLRAAMELVAPGGWLLADTTRSIAARRPSVKVARALRMAGADVIRRDWHLPARASATRIVPLDDPVAVQAALRRHGSALVRRLRARAAIAFAAVAPADLLGGDVTVVARRASEAPPALVPGLGAIGADLAAHARLREPSAILLTPQFDASAHVIWLISGDDGQPRLVAKVVRLPEDGPRLLAEAGHMRAVGASGADRGSVPQVVTSGEAGGHAVVVETALNGPLLDRAMVRSDPAHWIRAVSGWLDRMPSRAPASAHVTDARVGAFLTQLDESLGPEGGAARELLQRTRALLEPLRERPLPDVYEHGDLSHPNLVVVDAGRIGVLDWEAARADGLPLHDLCYFLGYVALSTGTPREAPYDGFLRVLAHPGWDARAALTRAAQRAGVDPGLISALVLCCWARSIARIVDRSTPAGEPLAPGSLGPSRYYAMWEGAVRCHDWVAALLS